MQFKFEMYYIEREKSPCCETKQPGYLTDSWVLKFLIIARQPKKNGHSYLLMLCWCVPAAHKSIKCDIILPKTTGIVARNDK